MSLKYHRFLSVSILHGFYPDGIIPSARDFVIEPTPKCREQLSQYGMLFRSDRNGCVVLCRIDPSKGEPTLFRSLGTEMMTFSFGVRWLNPQLLTVSELDRHNPGRQIFYLNNLVDDQEAVSGRRHLRDHVPGDPNHVSTRIGKPIKMVDRPALNYPFKIPVDKADLVLKDVLGDTLSFKEEHCKSTDPDRQMGSVYINLERIETMSSGRYLMEDDHGGSLAFYYDPTLFGQSIFGIIELMVNRPDVEDGDVILDGDTLQERGKYTIEFRPRKTTWQYVVSKKFETGAADLSTALVVGDGILFDKSLDDVSGPAVFKSAEEIPLSQIGKNVTLQEGASSRKLSSPGLQTTMITGENDRFISKIYVHV